jgi:hypothetical protein
MKSDFDDRFVERSYGGGVTAVGDREVIGDRSAFYLPCRLRGPRCESRRGPEGQGGGGGCEVPKHWTKAEGVIEEYTRVGITFWLVPSTDGAGLSLFSSCFLLLGPQRSDMLALMDIDYVCRYSNRAARLTSREVLLVVAIQSGPGLT